MHLFTKGALFKPVVQQSFRLHFVTLRLKQKCSSGFRVKKLNLYKSNTMAAPSIDSEFSRYWSLLTPVQKESLLSVIRSFVIPRERITLEDYNKEIDEAIARVEAGEFYTQEEVEKMAKDW
jgi:hypothetical protein